MLVVVAMIAVAAGVAGTLAALRLVGGSRLDAAQWEDRRMGSGRGGLKPWLAIWRATEARAS